MARFTVRVPNDLHETLVKQAEDQGVSLNLLVNLYLTSGAVVGAFTEALFSDAKAATVPQEN